MFCSYMVIRMCTHIFCTFKCIKLATFVPLFQRSYRLVASMHLLLSSEQGRAGDRYKNLLSYVLFIGVKKRLHSLCMTTPSPPLSSQNTKRAKDVDRTKDNRQRNHLTRMFTFMLPSTKTPASKEIELCPESDAI